MATVTIDYVPRAHQKRFHADRSRFRVQVWHRRAGKTVGTVNDLLRDLMTAKTFHPTVAYIAPLRNQAKRVAWPLVQHFGAAIPGVSFDQADLLGKFPGNRRFFLLGADNPDAIRGIGLDACALDEVPMISPDTWKQVIRPALAERNGRATFIGTPKGRMNLFHDLYEAAADRDGWSRDLLRADQSGVLPQHELDDALRDMGETEYAQEYLCSFNAAVTGSYYAREMAAAEEEDRITAVRYDKTLPVYMSFDLGWSALTAAWFAQIAGNELRVIHCQAWHHTSLADIFDEVRKMPFRVDEVLAPHDIEIREMSTGKSRMEVLYQAGFDRVTVVPKISVEDGREAVRNTLPRCVFDREACRTGIQALVQYRANYDDVTQVYSKQHVHDWASHYADGFRYLCVGVERSDVMQQRRRGRRRGQRPQQYGQVI